MVPGESESSDALKLPQKEVAGVNPLPEGLLRPD